MATTASGCARTSFGPVEIHSDSKVLTPRTWTLAQSEWAAELLPAGDDPILELHCGAGSIGLGAARLAGRPLVQVDNDPNACQWARANAARAGVNAEVRCGSVAEALLESERFPLVLADPPYVPTADVDRHPHDPRRSIDGGADGLHGATDVLHHIPGHLQPAAPLLLQTRGAAQAEQIERLLPVLAPTLTFDDLRVFGPDRAVMLLRGP